MKNWTTTLKAKEKDKIKKMKQPEWIKPMKATLTKNYFSDQNWIYERKLDGERVLIFKKNKKVLLMSRNKKNINKSYPELKEALENEKANNFIADGEIVAFDGKLTSFLKLQPRMHAKNKSREELKKIPVFLYIFDLIYFDRYSLEDLNLVDRKKILKKVLSFEDPLRYLIHRKEKGEKYHNEACKKGWEGVIAKDKNSRYLHSRSKKWLKFKCVNEQEFVIGGFTEPKGNRKGFGALLIGYYEDKKLKYSGKLGTGYDDEFLKEFSEKLYEIEEEDNVFKDKINEKNVHFVKPKYVAEAKFTEWTKDGRLRHPRFTGLRRDKDPKKVVRES